MHPNKTSDQQEREAPDENEHRMSISLKVLFSACAPPRRSILFVRIAGLWRKKAMPARKLGSLLSFESEFREQKETGEHGCMLTGGV
jgi:hypothetical protein